MLIKFYHGFAVTPLVAVRKRVERVGGKLVEVGVNLIFLMGRPRHTEGETSRYRTTPSIKQKNQTINVFLLKGLNDGVHCFEYRTTSHSFPISLKVLTRIVLSYDPLIRIELDKNRKLQIPRCQW